MSIKIHKYYGFNSASLKHSITFMLCRQRLIYTIRLLLWLKFVLILILLANCSFSDSSSVLLSDFLDGFLGLLSDSLLESPSVSLSDELDPKSSLIGFHFSVFYFIFTFF